MVANPAIAVPFFERSRAREPAAAARGTERQARLEGYLSNWGRWMRVRESIDLAYTVSQGYSGRTTVDDMFDEIDLRNAETVNAIVNSLPPAQQAAVYHAYDLQAVWRFPRNNFRQLLAAAFVAIEAGLIQRLDWAYI